MSDLTEKKCSSENIFHKKKPIILEIFGAMKKKKVSGTQYENKVNMRI